LAGDCRNRQRKLAGGWWPLYHTGLQRPHRREYGTPGMARARARVWVGGWVGGWVGVTRVCGWVGGPGGTLRKGPGGQTHPKRQAAGTPKEAYWAFTQLGTDVMNEWTHGTTVVTHELEY
jgi:hypothetical protein